MSDKTLINFATKHRISNAYAILCKKICDSAVFMHKT